MGQSINVLLYGSRIPAGIDPEPIIEEWERVVYPDISRMVDSISEDNPYRWGIARQEYVPGTPSPDDDDPDDLIGFYLCAGYHDDADSHRFPETSKAEIVKQCRRSWKRFARWARDRGVELGKARIWNTRTEVA